MQKPINPNGNYALYYKRDRQFHIEVMKKESPPFKFKLMVFRKREDPNAQARFTRDEENELF